MSSPNLDIRFDEMKTALQEKGVSITAKRRKLLEVLLASETHPSVGEIHEGVRRYYPGTSLATIYNTIELLKETGQVLEIEFSGAANRYDGRTIQSHPHLICVNCERVDDLDTIEFDDHVDEITSSTGYSIMRRRTDYYGVCPECQNEDAPLSTKDGRR